MVLAWNLTDEYYPSFIYIGGHIDLCRIQILSESPLSHLEDTFRCRWKDFITNVRSEWNPCIEGSLRHLSSMALFYRDK